MLDLNHEADLGDLWEELESRAVLLKPASESIEDQSPIESADEKRLYERFSMGRKAILKRGCESHAIYTKDCSRTGIGLISPVQIFPRERVVVHLNRQRVYKMLVTRCRRLGEKYYECGAIFYLK